MNTTYVCSFCIRLAVVAVGFTSLLLGPHCESASPKRGWGGAGADWVNATNSSWYFNWWHTRPGDDANANGQWVPLIKFYSTPENLQNKLDTVKSYADVDTLFVLNEPEREDQSNVSVQDAISFWPQIQQNLPSHKLVSPAVSDNSAGQAWLSSFMSQVNALNSNGTARDDLRVDAVAFHWYGASTPNNVAGAAANFLSRVDSYHNNYNRPVWITEFAIHDWGGIYSDEAIRQANAEFLDIVVPALESRNHVEGYSFYNWFSDTRIVEGTPLTPTVIGDQYIGTALPGETIDLAGNSLGSDVVYLRGGSLINTGTALIEAMRGIEVLGGLSTLEGSNDWSLANRADSDARVRSGATLQKSGSATVTLFNEVSVDGTLRVREGTLALYKGPLIGSGTTQVDRDAILQLSTGSRNPYEFRSHNIELAGTIDGALLASQGSTLTVVDRAAIAQSDVTLRGSVLDVGGPGFSLGSPSILPIQTGLQLNFDATLDVPGDSAWNDATGSDNLVTFNQAATPFAVAANDFPGLSAAYSIATVGGATGLNNYFEVGQPRSNQDATFEIVFFVQSLVGGSDQVLMEVGGVNRGAAFVLNDSTLTFNVDGDGGDVNISHAIERGWNQAVGVIDLTTGTDSITLCLNGEEVGAATGQNINDWAGGNPTGLGTGSSSVTGVSAGLGIPFHGDIAIARYYNETTFDSADALNNFQALQDGGAQQPALLQIGGDLNLDSDSELRLDVGDDGFTDKIEVAGKILIEGGTLSVGYAGDVALAAGDQFDLFDFDQFSGGFDAVSLPQLEAGLAWFLGGLNADGSILVTIEGDFTGDGMVDSSDYSAWRDGLGTIYSIADFEKWSANFGTITPDSVSQHPTSIPEPASYTLVAFAAAFLACHLKAKPACRYRSR